MKVSIIITSYNRGNMLGWTIDSTLRQTYKNTEIIVVDASTDEETKHVGKVRAQERFDETTNTSHHVSEDNTAIPRLKYLFIADAGISDARNRGERISTGDALLFLDDDNWIEPTYVEKTASLMTEGVGIVSTDMHVFSETKDSVVGARILKVEQLMEQNEIHSSSLIRREAFSQAGGFKEEVYEDWELWLNILKHNWKMSVVNEPLFHYRQASESLITKHNVRAEERIKNMREIHANIFKR